MEITEQELIDLGFNSHIEEGITYYGKILSECCNLALISMDKDFKTVGLYPYEYKIQFTKVDELQDIIRLFKDKTPVWNLIKNN